MLERPPTGPVQQYDAELPRVKVTRAMRDKTEARARQRGLRIADIVREALDVYLRQ
jgi:hypothetical protein